MKELTTAGNAIARLQLQALAPTLHGAHVGKLTPHPRMNRFILNVDA